MADQYVFTTRETKRYRFPTHTNDLVMCRSQADASEVFVVILEPGEAPPMHQHDDTEQIFFILSGKGTLHIGDETNTHALAPGDVVRIPIGTPHRIFCKGRQPMRYLAIDCFPAGTPTDEPTWDSHARVMCDMNGWDYDQVVNAQAH